MATWIQRTIYRDTLTGRFSKKSTWSRSVSHGGTRYVRQIVRVPIQEPVPAAPLPPREAPEPEGEGEEFISEVPEEFEEAGEQLFGDEEGGEEIESDEDY